MGNIVGFSARVLNPEDKPKYLNSAEHKAYEKSKLLYGLNFAKNYIREQQTDRCGGANGCSLTSKA